MIIRIYLYSICYTCAYKKGIRRKSPKTTPQPHIFSAKEREPLRGLIGGEALFLSSRPTAIPSIYPFIFASYEDFAGLFPFGGIFSLQSVTRP